LAASGWAYSDWITLEAGSASRLERLRLHIREVSDKISTGSYSVEGKSHDFDAVQRYLDRLLTAEKEEMSGGSTAAATETVFVRAVPIRPGGGAP
jgi:hypothetical protein